MSTVCRPDCRSPRGSSPGARAPGGTWRAASTYASAQHSPGQGPCTDSTPTVPSPFRLRPLRRHKNGAGGMIPGRGVLLRDRPVAPLRSDAAPPTHVRHCWVTGPAGDPVHGRDSSSSGGATRLVGRRWSCTRSRPRVSQPPCKPGCQLATCGRRSAWPQAFPHRWAWVLSMPVILVLV